MVRKWWLLVVLGASVLALAMPVVPVAAAPARDGVDWDGLPYYYNNSEGQFFYVPTDAKTFTAGRITNVFTGFSSNYWTPEQSTVGGLEAIWNKTCPAVDKQKISQSRRVYLPGPPGRLLVNLQMTIVDPASHKSKNPIAWAEVRINQTVVARVEGAKRKPNTWLSVDASNLRKSVNFGLNTITVVAQKAKTKKAWRFCSSKTDPGFGVSAEVLGFPAADLRTTIPATTAGDGVLDASATITNDGPSSVVGGALGGGQFNFTTYAETGTDVTELTLTSTETTCTTYNTGEGFVAICPLPVIATGQSIGIDIHVVFQAGCPFTIPTVFNAVSGWYDPNLANNGSSTRTISCSN